MLDTSASAAGVRVFISWPNKAPEALARNLAPLYPDYRIAADKEENSVILQIPDPAFGEIRGLI
jgi:hypothetical protein